MRLSVDKLSEFARELLKKILPDMADEILNADQSTQVGIEEQRARVVKVKEALKSRPRHT